MALFGTIETVRGQSPRAAVFATAWAYVEELMRLGSAVHRRVTALPSGASQKHELADGVFVIEQAYETKPRTEGFFESHRKYIDIQVVVTGEETMEVVDIAGAAVSEAYQESRDLIVYADTPAASLLRMKSGEAAVFFPVDVHMPSLRTGSSGVLVRKAVLKLPVQS